MDPSGGTPAHLIARRLRWALAFLASAAVLGVGVVMWGSYEVLGIPVLGWALRIIAAALGVLGLAACLSALVVSVKANGKKTAIVVGLGIAAIMVIVGMVLVVPVLGLPVVPAILTIVIILSTAPKNLRGGQRAPRWRSIMLAAGFALLTVATIVVGVLQITVWNPLAKLPGMSLDEIYSAMAAANQPTGDFGIAAWAGFWVVAALLLILVASIHPFSRFLTTRRMIVAGLLLVGSSASTYWFAAFAMGMNMADAFGTTGNDANSIGIILSLIGHTTLAAGLLVGLSPEPLIATTVEVSAV